MEIYIYIHIILSNSSNDGIECDLTQCEKMGKNEIRSTILRTS